MKKVLFVFFCIFTCLPILSQTDEQLHEWYKQGTSAAKQEKYQEAIRYLEQYREGYGKIHSQKDEQYATILHVLAIYYDKLENHSKAVELCSKAMELYKEVLGENNPYYAISLENLADFCVSLGNYEKAVEVQTQLVEVRKSTVGENNPEFATALSFLANYYYHLDKKAQAAELYSKVADIRKRVLGESHSDYAMTLDNLVVCYSSLGNYAKAVEIQAQLVEVYKSTLGKEHPDYAASLHKLSEYYSELGNYTKSVELETNVVEILHLSGEKNISYASSLSDLASYYNFLGNYSMAVEIGEQALDILKNINGENTKTYAMSLGVVAHYYDNLGDYKKAIELGTSSIDIFRYIQEDDNDTYASLLDLLAMCHYKLGDYTKALEFGIQAVEVYDNNFLSVDDELWGKSLDNLSVFYASLGNHKKAIEVCTEALEVLDEEHPDYAKSIRHLSIYYDKLGNYSKGMEYGMKAMEILNENLDENALEYALSLGDFAHYYAWLDNYEKAVEMATQALETIRDKIGENTKEYASALRNLAYCHSYYEYYYKAVEYNSKALQIFRKVLGDKDPDYALCLSNLSYDYYYLGDLEKTFLYFRENASILQSNIYQQFAGLTASQRTILWEKDSYIFTNVYPSLIYQAHATTAPDLYDKSALFAKGLLLSTEIEMNRLIQESGDEEALRMFGELQRNRLQLQKLYEKPIAECHINVDSLAQVIDRQEQALVKRSKVYGDFTRKLRTTWQDVQNALKKDEIAIEFLSFRVYDSDSIMVTALTLRKDDKEPKFIPLFEQRQLQQVSDPHYFYSPELTALVWQPLRRELQGVKRIYFSPAGVLYNIGIEYAPGMENYEMCRLSTTREIITSPTPSQGGKKEAILYGGVDYDAQVTGPPPSEVMGEVSIALHRSLIDSLDIRGAKAGLSSLPGTKIEVENIKASFDKKRKTVSLTMGREATETSVKTLSANTPRILHIATHGFYFTEKQASKTKEKYRFLTIDNDRQSAIDTEDKALMRSGLLMAGANATLRGLDMPMEVDDGILTAQEISRLDLRGLDLVVLSACKTGNGDINQGEGVFGLQRGFKKAGAQTIVMSLWEVADDATQILMTSFYDNLLQGQSKRDAFHNAQQHLRTVNNGEFNHPQFWTAFILLD